MRILLLSVSAVALLLVGAAVAEPTHPNEVGLYLNQEGSGPYGTAVIGTPVDVYLVLTLVTNMDGSGPPFFSCGGFECLFTFNPAPSLLLLVGTELPPGSLDIGRFKDIQEGILEFIVGITQDAGPPIINDAIVLARLTFLNLDTAVTEVSLGPVEDFQSLPGQMAYVGVFKSQEIDPVLSPMYSIGGSHEAPVFVFNGEAVAVEQESFGSVKALYR